MHTPISPETANHVLWHFGHGGHQPGTFTQNLITAFCSADLENKARLGEAYPDLLAAITAMEYDPDGIANLRRIATGQLRCVHCGDEDGPWAGTPDQPVCEQCAHKDGALA